MDVVQTENGIYRNCSFLRALEMVPQHLSTFDSVEQSLRSKLVYGDIAMLAWTSYRVCGLFMDVVQTDNGF